MVAAGDACASVEVPVKGIVNMKLKFVFAMMAAGGLFVAPALADHHADDKKAAMEAKAEDSVAAYVVAASGGG